MTKILHTYVKFWSILYTNIIYLNFVSLCWQSAFVTCQKRQNVGKFDIKHSILTKKGLNLALFWSKLYKHIILQRIFLQIWRICTDWNEYRGKIYVFFDNLNILVLESAFSVQIFAFIEVFFGKNRKNTVVFAYCRLCFVFFWVIKRLLSKYCQWKPVLCMQVLAGRLSEGFLLLCWWLICSAVSSLLRCVGWFLDRGMHLRIL